MTTANMLEMFRAVILLCLIWLSASTSKASTMDVREPFFESKVRPLLAIHCFECHGEDSQEGGLRLDNPKFLTHPGENGPVVVPEKPDESRLVQAVRHEGDLKMPPENKLHPEQVAVLVEWVSSGAFWPKSDVALVKSKRKPGGSLFSDEEKAFWAYQPMREAALPQVQDSDWPTSPLDRFIRGAQELVGIAPAQRADRRRLLRRVYFDLTGLPPTPDEIESFVTDRSPNAFVKVVDRLLSSPRYGERWGRHWLDVARFAESAAHDGNNAYINAFRYRDYVISAFNQDLPYDRFVIEQLAGDLLPKTGDVATDLDRVVATGFLQVGPKPVVMRNKHQMLREIADEQIHATGVVFMGLTLGCARCHDHKFDPIPTQDYYSLAGIFLSTEMMQDFLADSKWIEYMMPAPGGGEVKVMGVRDQPTPSDVRIHIRGNYEQLGDLAPRRVLRIIAGEDQPPLETNGSGRLELAQWITGDEHPLTARVMVNRIWQWHFGTGLVASSGDFGVRGEKPSHPDLLDWLARRFVESSWSVKSMHRRILLSSTYQQAHVENPTATQHDPNNRLLWRMPRRRLTGEEVRDSLLALGGSLDNVMGGSDFDYKAIQAGGAPERELYALGSRPKFPLPRRSVYLPVVRNFRPEIMRLFDAAIEHESTSKRHETTVAPQSLFFLNSPVVRQQSLRLAQSLAPDENTVPDEDQTDEVIVQQAYQAVLGRNATPAETADGIDFLRQFVSAIDPDGRLHEQNLRQTEDWKKRLAESKTKKKMLVPHDKLVMETNGLLFYYRFNEPSGTQMAVNAPSPGIYDAEIQDGVQLGVAGSDDVISEDGTPNTAIELDGTGPHVRMLDAFLFGGSAAETMTVEYWMRPAKIADAMVIGRDQDKNGGRRNWKSGVIARDVEGERKLVVYHEFFDDGGGFRTRPEPAFVAEVGQWTHVAFTFGSGLRRLYVNGHLVDELAAGARVPNHGLPLTIGATASGNEAFHGSIDEVAIYGTVLDQTTIQSHFQGTANLTRPTLPPSPQLLAVRSFCQSLMCLNEFIYIE